MCNTVTTHDSLYINLTADRTYFVNGGTGSNNNDGLTPSTAFATLQKAWDTIGFFNANGNSVSISIAAGTYTEGLVGSRGPLSPAFIVLQGSGVADCTVSATGEDAFLFENVSVTIDGFKLQTTTGGDSLSIRFGARVVVGDIEFGACAGNDVLIDANGFVDLTTSYKKSGNTAGSHHHVINGGTLAADGINIELEGTPTFGGYFCGVSTGRASYVNATCSGSGAIGQRYYVHHDGSIITNGTFVFPGTIAGSNVGGNFGDQISYIGVADGSNAATGVFGEYHEEKIAPSSITTGTPTDIVHIDLTAGDWDIGGNVVFAPNNTSLIKNLQGSINYTSATMNTEVGTYSFNSYPSPNGSAIGFETPTLTMPTVRKSSASPFTAYLVAQTDFSVNINNAGGKLWARRAR